MRWQERQKEWEVVLSLKDARIAELEAALRELLRERDKTGAVSLARWEQLEQLVDHE